MPDRPAIGIVTKFLKICQCVPWFAAALVIATAALAQTQQEIVVHRFKPYGSSNHGVVFEIDASGHESVLYSFTGGSDGGSPYSGVLRNAAGDLFGTASAGGSNNAGVVYKLSAGGAETVLYSFSGGLDGGSPYSGLIAGPGGKLFGTAYGFGTGAGVVFEIK